MSSEVTTEVCKAALDERFPASYGNNVGGWKRVSKTGKADADIIRIFHHRTLDVIATVIERDGAITSVEYGVLSQSKNSGASKKTTGSPKAPSKKTVRSSAAASTSTVVPEAMPEAADYLFAFNVAYASRDGYTHFAVCPKAFWDKNHHLSDSLDQALLTKLLPPDASARSEAFFSTRLKKKELRAFMLARGFGEDAGLTAYLAD